MLKKYFHLKSNAVYNSSAKNPDQVSLHAQGDFELPAKNVLKSSKGKTKQRVEGKGNSLKKECDLLEYEVMQTEKLQDYIDKYKEKTRDLTKKKSGLRAKQLLVQR